MLNYFLNCYIVLVLVLMSCNTTSKPPASDNEDKDVIKIAHQVKLVFFTSCLSGGFDHSEAVKRLIRRDKSVARDFPLGKIYYDKVDSIASRVVQEILIDSTNMADNLCGNCPKDEQIRMYESGLIGRRVFEYCLSSYCSVELDSISLEYAKEILSK